MPIIAYYGQSGDDAELIADKFAKTLTQDKIIFWADPSLKRLEKMLDTGDATWVVTPINGIGDSIETKVEKYFGKKHKQVKTFEKQLTLCLYTLSHTNKDEISLIASTPLGFELAKPHLDKNYPDIDHKEFSTFSEAAEWVWTDTPKKDRPKNANIAVICSDFAGKSREMKCLKKRVQKTKPKIKYVVWRK